MISRRTKRAKIYQSRTHILVTLLFIVVPFLFLLVFSRLAHITTGKLFSDLFISAGRLAAAYGLAAIIGWLSAVLFYHGKRAVIALPIFDVLQSFPTFAALPMAVFLWGHSNFVVIFFLIITVIWPIFFSIISSLKLIKRDWQEVAEIAGLSGFNYLKIFLLPITMPGLITGSIIGLGEGWEALVATEIITGVKSGLGGFFETFSRNIPITALGIFGFLIFIFSVNKLIWLPLLEWSHHKMEE
ncbi:MAG: ABC transporter permease subunit [Parcubacteria group bacterium]|nr:ABC transporter permease subunit [Parcubacteria group bacterium]